MTCCWRSSRTRVLFDHRFLHWGRDGCMKRRSVHAEPFRVWSAAGHQAVIWPLPSVSSLDTSLFFPTLLPPGLWRGPFSWIILSYPWATVTPLDFSWPFRIRPLGQYQKQNREALMWSPQAKRFQCHQGSCANYCKAWACQCLQNICWMNAQMESGMRGKWQRSLSFTFMLLSHM